jgi:hypothetical protein
VLLRYPRPLIWQSWLATACLTARCCACSTCKRQRVDTQKLGVI